MTQAEAAPLITDEMRANVGVRQDPVIHEVDKLQIRLFARSVGHVDPIFFDEEEAKKAGYRSLPCPPGYLGTPVYDPRNSDPTFGAARSQRPNPQPSRPLKRMLNGGTEFDYYDDICAGDVLEAVNFTADVQERKGSIGDMLITTSKTEFTRKSDGKLVAVMTGTGIRY